MEGTINDKLPIYKLVIDKNKESGVDFIALVDEPAINMGWQMFGKMEPLKFLSDGSRRIISGPLMVADLPIYRRDEKLGEYYVVFDANTIEQIVMRFMENAYTSNINLMHDSKGSIPDGVFLFESFIIDRKRGNYPPEAFKDLSDGSWYGSMKINNEELWSQYIATGVFTGFSVEGLFSYTYAKSEDQNLIEEIIKVMTENQ